MVSAAPGLRRVLRALAGIGLLVSGAAVVMPSAHAQQGLSMERLGGRAPFRQAAPQPGTDLVTPPGSPLWDMRFSTGSLSPIMRFAFEALHAGNFGLSALAQPDSHEVGPFVMPETDGSGTADTDQPGGAADLARHGGSGPLAGVATRPRRGGIPTGCTAGEVESELQGGTAFWGPQARSAVPVQFPAAVFTGNTRGGSDPLGLGPTGHPVNLPVEGPAGGWCRPPPTPMSQSSPLVLRSFWILVLFPIGVMLVYFLSRGPRLRPVHNA